MHRHACLLALALATGCTEDAVTIEIHRGATTAERVELYLVDGHCESAGGQVCNALATPSAQTYVRGTVYTRSVGKTLAANFDANGVATFRIVPDAATERVHLAVAVGVAPDSDSGAPRKPVGGVQLAGFSFGDANVAGTRRIATLETVKDTEVHGEPNLEPGLRIEAWYRDSDEGCIAVQRTLAGKDEEPFFIVPADDTDCDDWTGPQECAALWPDHKSDDGTGVEFSCLHDTQPTAAGGMCLMGNAICEDGQGSRACDATKSNDGTYYCLPSDICDGHCRGSGEPLCAFNALRNPPAATTRIECTVKVAPNTTQKLEVCGENGDTAYATLGVSANVSDCEGVDFGFVQDGQFTFSPVTVEYSAELAAEILERCDMRFKFKGAFVLPATPTAGIIPDRVVRITLDNEHALLVPFSVVLEEQPTCGMGSINSASCAIFPDLTSGLVDRSLLGCAMED